VTKAPITSKNLILDICCDDLEGNEADVPYVNIILP
jgi:hypothetical protein